MWIGKHESGATLQSINSMHWRPSLQRRRIEIRGRIVKSMLSNSFEMLILGTYWKTRYSMVSEQTCTDRSQNGPKLVTNDYLVWSLTFITHVNTNSIAMWVILQNNADWDCFKTPILEIFRIQNLLQVEHCVRNKLQFRTVLRKLKSFLSMQVYAWTVFPLSLWDSVIEVFHSSPNQTNKTFRSHFGSSHFLFEILVSQVLVWHHCHHVFASSCTRQSRPSFSFPRVNNFSIVTTNACCRFR